jgi:DNA-binding response OmpR family regulator
VIFLSAKDTIRDQRYGYKLGATTYLTKPFQPDRLLRNINSIFEHTPPERKTKKHSLRKARELVQAIASGELPEEKPEKPKAPHSQTVHHREAETPEDSIWRG